MSDGHCIQWQWLGGGIDASAIANNLHFGGASWYFLFTNSGRPQDWAVEKNSFPSIIQKQRRTCTNVTEYDDKSNEQNGDVYGVGNDDVTSITEWKNDDDNEIKR